MPVNILDIQYRGDAADVKDLLESYRVSDYLEAFEANRRKQDQGLRQQLLKDGIRLSASLSPRIYRLFGELCGHLGVTTAAEVFCLPSDAINAFAALDDQESGSHALIGVTSGALEKLDDGEIKAILGHEIGHFLFGTNRLLGLISTDASNPSVTVLPPLGESLFLRWRKKAELSADRVGLLVCGSFPVAARALLKSTFGLSERNLNLDLDALMAQIDEIKGRPELIEEAFATHPLLPIRLKALELFSRSEKAARNGFPAGAAALSDESLESEVDNLVVLTRRYPFKPLTGAMMRAVALGGAMVLGADGEVTNEETKMLIQVLHRFFTDEPENEIVTDQAAVLEKLPEQIAILNKEGDGRDKAFVLSRLAELALADGALMDKEGEVIFEIAEKLEMPSRAAYGIVVGAAQAVGFKTDVKLNRIAADLRRSLQVGLPRGMAAARPA